MAAAICPGASSHCRCEVLVKPVLPSFLVARLRTLTEAAKLPNAEH